MGNTSSYSRNQISDLCLTHMVNRLEETETKVDPYPHFWTDKILPEEIFDRLITEMPDYALFSQGAEKGYNVSRGNLQLMSEWMEQLPGQTRELWFGVRSALGSQQLKRVIFKRLAPGIAHRFSIDESEAPDVEAYPRPQLYSETKGYSIPPHPDTRRKIATVQFALTDDESQIDLGTSIYQLSANPKHLVRKPRGFREVKKYPFIRNSVFAFSVVNMMSMRSWHGREALEEGCGIRNTLLHIYYGNASDANQELLEDFQVSAAA